MVAFANIALKQPLGTIFLQDKQEYWEPAYLHILAQSRATRAEAAVIEYIDLVCRIHFGLTPLWYAIVKIKKLDMQCRKLYNHRLPHSSHRPPHLLNIGIID